jgi:peptidoglycan/LPS O-acetylase OafA/YrhL
MYILHIPLLWWYSRLGSRWFRHLPPTASGLLYAAGVLAVSAAAFRFCEAPASRLIRGWVREPARSTGAITSFPERQPEQVR